MHVHQIRIVKKRKKTYHYEIIFRFFTMKCRMDLLIL